MRELEHTADVGFEIQADTLDELFRGAADGLLHVYGLSAGVTADAPVRERQEMELARPDLERLLVAWLRELVYGIQSGRGVPSVEELRVEPEGGDDESGRGVARAAVRWVLAPEPAREVKAVTYHGLRVTPSAGGWHARVILDV